jgi:SAM-dependent methyltransferase
MSAPSTHYDDRYFEWQKHIGAFGGVANLFKFKAYIRESDAVLDFGCGGGYLLKNIVCRAKLGVELNPVAREEAAQHGITTVAHINEIADSSQDVIVSNHALEHVRNPFEVISELKSKLKRGAIAVFVVPHHKAGEAYAPGDVNHHLYSWNPLTLGNLFSEAGYKIEKAESFQHQWPPNYAQVFSESGEKEFHRVCHDYAVQNQNHQIRVVARRSA